MRTSQLRVNQLSPAAHDCDADGLVTSVRLYNGAGPLFEAG